MSKLVASFAAAVIGASVAGFTVSAEAADSAPLPISIGVQTDADWPTIEAQHNHLFEKAGLKPSYIKFVAGAPMLAAAESKSIDVATPGFVPFLAGIGQGIPWVSIGIDTYGPRGEGFVARNGSGITSIADLKGKRIGYFRASTAHYALITGLKKNHISPDQVTLLSMAPSAQVAAMRAGNIDAAEVWEPWLHIMAARGNGKVFADESDIGVTTAAGMFAVRRDWLATHQETAKRFLTAILMADEALAKDPKPAIHDFAVATGIPDDWAAEIYEAVPSPDLRRWTDPTYAYSLVPNGQVQHSLVDLAAFLYEQKIIPHPIDVSDVLDDSVAAAVIKAHPAAPQHAGTPPAADKPAAETATR